MAPFSKPETVLKQAEGLVSVGQTPAALQSLTEMFSSKRFRSTPLASLEPIMHRFVELCVELRKGRTAKEGLMQYKNIAQNTSVASIESVILRFVQLADSKVKEAQDKAKAVTVAVDVDDLEASETPESILLGAVSGDQTKDRTDRALVTPWLKFLWESYRTSLETLKNNARLEVIYQQIAQQAFKFCLKHQRKVEFRRLCETLRLHLQNLAKYAHQPHSINLADPDTLQHHLDTRFAQLNTSVELELWQEAFRSVEDVHNLLTMAKKAPRPAMMANYYEKLTKIFLTSGNALYHAAAWGRYYSIVTNMGGKSPEDMGRLAGQVLISALAVPVGLNLEEGEEGKGKNSRLTALLGLSKTPTRASLLKDALSRDVLRLSPESIKSLYNVLEVTFDPLSLCAIIAPLLQTLAADAAYSPYLPLLQRALLSRLLNQLSQVYSTIKIASLHELVAPLRAAAAEGGQAVNVYDDSQIEAYVMGCARRGELGIKVDHAAGSITFVDDPFATRDDAASASAPGPSSLSLSLTLTRPSSGENAIQPSTADFVRTRLSGIAASLHDALVAIQAPETSTGAAAAGGEAEKLAALVAAAHAERKALQLRRALVARRRELLSELSARKEKEEASRRAETSRREKEEEERRLREDARRKEIERINNVRQNILEAETRQMWVKLKGTLKVQPDENEPLDAAAIMKLQLEQLEKEKKELNERLRIVAKRVDHLERAYRKAERPLLAEDYERQQLADHETFDAMQRAHVEAARLAHRQDVETKRRVERLLDDCRAHRAVILAKRGEQFAKRKAVAEKRIQEEKAKRTASVIKAREAARKQLLEKERLQREEEEEEARREAEQLAEQQRREAEAAAALAAAEAKKREEEERNAAIRKQREEERKAALEQARLQQQREDEAAERAAKRAADRAKQQQAPPAAPARAAADTDGSHWRRTTSATATTPAYKPARPPVAAESLRSESPAPPKVRPAGQMSWREREAAKTAAATGGGGTPSPRPASPMPTTTQTKPDQKEDEGFQTVEKKTGVWKPRRGRGI